MKEHVCICLSCGGQFSVKLKDESDLRRKTCPTCGSTSIVKHNPLSYFRALFGGFGGG